MTPKNPKLTLVHSNSTTKETVSNTTQEIKTLPTLQDNLKALNDLHSRLRYMLQELESLVTK